MIFKGIIEGTTRLFTATILDENSVAIPAASLATLTVTLTSLHSGAIINSRNAQSILNANGGVVDSAGKLSWTMSAADNAILNSALAVESHRALFIWTYGGKTGKAIVDFLVDSIALD